ncbi:MAG: hypothetical protein CVV05_01050 [Gammaproteobacteria bacterium HGW-Gammaproteobacteria-1]|jgi:hypothetical protein|nr:MAG: hypothetical protein CVV05_01050 [Gammaproteobacteria bacterium HGW-Gammaproteobacteria-1]
MSLVTDTFGILVDRMTKAAQDLADRFVTSIGTLGDSINTQSSEIYARELAHSAEFSVDPCYAAEVARGGQQASAKAHENTAVDSIRLTAHFGSLTTTESVKARLGHTAKLVHTYGRGKPRETKDRGTEFLARTQLGGSAGNADPDVQDVLVFIENVGGDSLYQTPAVSTNAGTVATIPYEAQRVTYSARRSLGLLPFVGAKNTRVPPTNEGRAERDMLYEEIARTYGNETWRKELEAYKDTKPVMAEACHLATTQNKLLLKQVELYEHGNLVLAAIILEALESPERAARLGSSFIATGASAAGSIRNQPVPAPDK